MSVMRSLARRRRWLPWAGLAAVVLIAFGLWFFEPQALFLNDTVSEAAPRVNEMQGDNGDDSSDAGSAQGVIATGEFRPLAHDARGTALLIEAADGKTYLRFEGFEVENGPDLKVYLSRAQADASDGELADEIVDLGELKGNIGDQNYLVPASVDLTGYRSAVVWCRRFSVGFAVAPLNVRGS
ncbi:MAG: DM13 domain-containing protein [Actinomycetota bacterium]